MDIEYTFFLDKYYWISEIFILMAIPRCTLADYEGDWKTNWGLLSNNYWGVVASGYLENLWQYAVICSLSTNYFIFYLWVDCLCHEKKINLILLWIMATPVFESGGHQCSHSSSSALFLVYWQQGVICRRSQFLW